MSEYICSLAVLIEQHDIQRDRHLIFFKFHIGLRSKLQPEMLLHTVDSFEETYQLI